MRGKFFGLALGTLPFALSLLSAMLLMFCLPAAAQQTKRIFRIGYLSSQTTDYESARAEGIRLALRQRGYAEGENVAFEYRYSEGKTQPAPELAAELVRLKVDIIIVAGGLHWSRAAKDATKTIPIVMAGAGSDPVKAGLIESLRPAGRQRYGSDKPRRKIRRQEAGASKRSSS